MLCWKAMDVMTHVYRHETERGTPRWKFPSTRATGNTPRTPGSASARFFAKAIMYGNMPRHTFAAEPYPLSTVLQNDMCLHVLPTVLAGMEGAVAKAGNVVDYQDASEKMDATTPTPQQLT